MTVEMCCTMLICVFYFFGHPIHIKGESMKINTCCSRVEVNSATNLVQSLERLNRNCLGKDKLKFSNPAVDINIDVWLKLI